MQCVAEDLLCFAQRIISSITLILYQHCFVRNPYGLTSLVAPFVLYPHSLSNHNASHSLGIERRSTPYEIYSLDRAGVPHKLIGLTVPSHL